MPGLNSAIIQAEDYLDNKLISPLPAKHVSKYQLEH